MLKINHNNPHLSEMCFYLWRHWRHYFVLLCILSAFDRICLVIIFIPDMVRVNSILLLIEEHEKDEVKKCKMPFASPQARPCV